MNLHSLSRTKGITSLQKQVMKVSLIMRIKHSMKFNPLKALLQASLLFVMCVKPSTAEETAVITQPLPKETLIQDGQTEDAASSDFIFKYLAAEVAAQRGELGLATQLFFDLAKSKQNPQLAQRATQLAIFTQNAQIGLAASNLWIELSPDALEPRQTATQILVMSGDLNSAKSHLQRLLLKEDTRADGFLYLNTLLANQSDKKAVLDLVQDLAEPYPQLAEAHLTVSQAALQAQQIDLAIKSANLATKLKPDWELAAIQQSELLYIQSPDKAIKFYRQFLNKHNTANDARLSLVKMLVSQKRFNETPSELKLLAKAAESKPEILVVIGMLALQSNHFDDAEKYLKQALSAKLLDKDLVYLYLGQLAEKKQNDAEALNWFAQIQAPHADSNNNQSASHYLEAKINTAMIISRTQGVDAAINMLDDLQDLSNMQIALVIQTQANLLMQAKRYQEGFELLDKAVINIPGNAELIYDYAMAAEKIEKFDVVETQLRNLIKIKPNFAQAYNALGYSFADRNIQLDEALTLIEKALSFNPNDHYVIDSMGWVNYRLGQLDKAVHYLQMAYKIQADAEIAAHLGEVLWQQGRQKEAEEIWDEALKTDPDHEALKNTIKKFKPS